MNSRQREILTSRQLIVDSTTTVFGFKVDSNHQSSTASTVIIPRSLRLAVFLFSEETIHHFLPLPNPSLHLLLIKSTGPSLNAFPIPYLFQLYDAILTTQAHCLSGSPSRRQCLSTTITSLPVTSSRSNTKDDDNVP